MRQRMNFSELPSFSGWQQEPEERWRPTRLRAPTPGAVFVTGRHSVSLSPSPRQCLRGCYHLSLAPGFGPSHDCHLAPTYKTYPVAHAGVRDTFSAPAMAHPSGAVSLVVDMDISRVLSRTSPLPPSLSASLHEGFQGARR